MARSLNTHLNRARTLCGTTNPLKENGMKTRTTHTQAAQATTLLTGKRYVPAESTDIRKTWRAAGHKVTKKCAAPGATSTYAKLGRAA